MSTVTSRLGLTIPEVTDSMALGDDVLSANYDLIDTNIGFRTVTNLSDITTPFNGQLAFQTSDSNPYIRVNSQWIRLNLDQSATRTKRLVAEVSTAGPFTPAGNTQEQSVLLCQINTGGTFTKKYLVHIQYNVKDTVFASSFYTMRFMKSTDTTVTYADTIVARFGMPVGQPLDSGIPRQDYPFTGTVFYDGSASDAAIGLIAFGNSSCSFNSVNMYVYEWSD